MASKTTRIERRELVERMLLEDHARSDRSISRACAVSHSLVGTVRTELVAAGRIDRRPDRHEADVQASNGRNANLLRQRAGEPGPALRHGAESVTRLAPLRIRFEASVREEFAGVVDDRRLFLLADLLARVESARRWLDDRGGVVRNRSGDVFAVVDRLERWSARADALLKELHEVKRASAKVDPQAALDAYVAGLGHGEVEDDGDT